MKPQTEASLAPDEIARFSARAQDWWDPSGPFRALHELMPLRVRYVCDQIAAWRGAAGLEGLRVLDLGCGGGLMAEALAARGALVTGLDASAEAISCARAHAARAGLDLSYHADSCEAFAREAAGAFDIVLALEILEHVRDARSFLAAAADLLAPEGLLIAATMNRTRRSFLFGVVAAEYLLGWVPAGTHDWDKFLKPSELADLLRAQGVEPCDLTGFVYKPLQGGFALQKGRVAVNYFMAARKKPAL